MSTTLSRRSLLRGLGLSAAAGVPALAVATAADAGAATRPTALVLGNVNIRRGPGTQYPSIRVVPRGARVQLTGPRVGKWRPVRYGATTGYVSAYWLELEGITVASADRAVSLAAPQDGAGYASLPAASRYSGPSGVTSTAAAVAAEMHARFPQVASVGGYRNEAGSDHSSGRAVDLMLPGDYRGAAQQALGQAMAEHARANADRLGISYVIWDQHIWSVGRRSEGWRLMPDRGSDNANHRNHVHISVN